MTGLEASGPHMMTFKYGWNSRNLPLSDEAVVPGSVTHDSTSPYVGIFPFLFKTNLRMMFSALGSAAHV